MNRTKIAALVAALALAAAAVLVGCAPADPEPAAPAPAEIVAPEPVDDGVTEEQAAEFAAAVCAVLDAHGVYNGTAELFRIARENGIDEEQAAPLFGASVVAECPEYGPQIREAAGTL